MIFISKLKQFNDLQRVYSMNSLRTFALSMISLFFPIYLLTKNFSLTEVFIITLFNYIFLGVFSYFAFKTAQSSGLGRILLISTPAIIIHFMFLYQIDLLVGHIGKLLFSIILVLSYGLSSGFYWTALNFLFFKSSDNTKSVEQIGIFNILGISLGAIGPLIGAYIIIYLGFEILFPIIIILVFLSTVPFLFGKHLVDSFKTEIKKDFFKKIIRGRNFLGYAGTAFLEVSTSFFWPLFIFYSFNSIKDLGFIYTASNIVLVFVTYFLSKKIKDQNKFFFIRLGSILFVLSILLRVFLSDFYFMVIVQSIGALFAAMYELPYVSIVIKNSKKAGLAEEIFDREIYLMIGRCLLLILGLFFIHKLATLDALALLTGISAILGLTINKLKEYT